MTQHKIETERVNGGVIAVCSDWDCAWKGIYVFTRTNRVTGKREEVQDGVFPNRKLALVSFRKFHS